MRPFKAVLFLLFCLLGLAAVGTAVSHFWNTQKLLNNERRLVSVPKIETPSAASVPAPDQQQ